MKVNKDITFKESLAEANSSGLRYALLDKEGNIRHTLIRCKDYIQDVYWSEITKHKSEFNIYGFVWNGLNDNPISKQETVSMLLVPDSFNNDLSPYCKNLNNFLNIIEETLDIPPSKVEISESDNKDLIVTYDNNWSKRPYLISLLLLLMRNGLFFEGNNIDDVLNYLNDKTEYKNKWLSNDLQQVKGLIATDKLKTLFVDKMLPEIKWKNYSLRTIHNSSGILSCVFDLKKETTMVDE